MTKEDELIMKHGGFSSSVPPSSFALSQVRHIVRGVLPLMEDAEWMTPTYYKKGDLFQGMGINSKPRPFVIAKVVKDGVYAIPLTTNEDEYALIPHNSRFLKAGFLGNQLVFVRIQVIKPKFLGVFDDSKSLNKAIKIITDKFKKEFR